MQKIKNKLYWASIILLAIDILIFVLVGWFIPDIDDHTIVIGITFALWIFAVIMTFIDERL